MKEVQVLLTVAKILMYPEAEDDDANEENGEEDKEIMKRFSQATTKLY